MAQPAPARVFRQAGHVVNANGEQAQDGRLRRAVRTFERIVVLVMLAMMMLVVALSTVELAWIVIRDIVEAPILLLEVNDLLEIFGFFLLVLIGLELLEIIKAYQKDQAVQLGIVLEVALIAIARKVIVLDLSEHDGVSVLAVAALIVALSIAWALEKLVRRADR